MRQVTDATFDEEVLAAGAPVLVSFGADWCRPCRAFEPVLAALASAPPGVEIVRATLDGAPVGAERAAIRSIPSLALFRDGRAVARLHGVRRDSEIRSWLARSLRAAG